MTEYDGLPDVDVFNDRVQVGVMQFRTIQRTYTLTVESNADMTNALVVVSFDDNMGNVPLSAGSDWELDLFRRAFARDEFTYPEYYLDTWDDEACREVLRRALDKEAWIRNLARNNMTSR